MSAAVEFANKNFPKSFVANENDVFDVCNGTNCFQVRRIEGSWRSSRGSLGVSTDSYKSNNKNYINLSVQGASAWVDAPAHFNGSNYLVVVNGHWDSKLWSYNGVPYQITDVWVVDSVEFVYVGGGDPYLDKPPNTN
ncbi:hypothetical protein HNQ51_000339 [Inhella inkyongensis]|uniref:Uncharacterized protein n=1 Tax=Inhella inkyongensis TaxID=392593 RepID=A0A840S1T4_9BURK|nr:hypothetical protein [Inhella inkyongensis]MBB5203046.1 hypothetical protein [Inhella inkyongensis]